MSATPQSRSLLRAVLGTVSLVCSLIVLPIGFVMLVLDSEAAGSGTSDNVRPLGVLVAGGALLAFGIAMLIWEMSVRYDIRR